MPDVINKTSWRTVLWENFSHSSDNHNSKIYVNLLNYTLIKNQLDLVWRSDSDAFPWPCFRLPYFHQIRGSSWISSFSWKKWSKVANALAVRLLPLRTKISRFAAARQGHLASPDFAFKILVSLARRLNFGPGPDFWYGPITPVHLYILR